MIRLIVLIFCASYSFSFSQDYDYKLEVLKSDLENSVYNKDSTANAFVFYEKGFSFVDNKSFQLVTIVHKKIKILNKNGFEKANIEIPIFNNKDDSESVGNIKGATFNLKDGIITKTLLKQSAVYLDNKGFASVVKFPMPNIQEGSVIVYSYVIKSPFMYKFKEWYFQEDIPKIHSEYTTSIPGNYQYNIQLIGFLDFYSKESEIVNSCLTTRSGGVASCAVTKYIMKDIPAFRKEKYMTSYNNYISRLDFELKKTKSFYGKTNNITKTWKSTDKELKSSDFFGKQVKKNSLVKNILPDSIRSLKKNVDKAKIIYNYVINNYKWNGSYFYGNSTIREVKKNKTGNVFSINLLLKNLLESQGFDVKPVLLSTRENGFATKLYPVISDFNYLIIYLNINNSFYLLDATESYLSFGELPFRCLNGYGRLFDFKKGSDWIDIKASDYSIQNYRFKLELEEDYSVNGDLEAITTGYPSHSLRNLYFENPENYYQSFENEHPNFNIKNHNVITELKNSYNFKELVSINFEQEFTDKFIYLNPFLLKFFSKNPFKLKERNYPIDFGYKNVYQFNMVIDLNNYLKVYELPKTINIALPNGSGSATFNVTTKDNKLNVFLKIKFDRAVYEKEYYEAIKTFLAKIVEIQNNTIIVLEKK